MYILGGWVAIGQRRTHPLRFRQWLFTQRVLNTLVATVTISAKLTVVTLLRNPPSKHHFTITFPSFSRQFVCSHAIWRCRSAARYLKLRSWPGWSLGTPSSAAASSIRTFLQKPRSRDVLQDNPVAGIRQLCHYVKQGPQTVVGPLLSRRPHFIQNPKTHQTFRDDMNYRGTSLHPSASRVQLRE